MAYSCCTCKTQFAHASSEVSSPCRIPSVAQKKPKNPLEMSALAGLLVL